MTTQPDSLALITGLQALHEALGRLSAALVTGQPDAVLATEESLGGAMRQLAARRPIAGEDPRELVDTIRAVRVGVFTCQRLGRASAGMIQATNAGGPYAANGRVAPAIVPGTVISRT